MVSIGSSVATEDGKDDPIGRISARPLGWFERRKDGSCDNNGTPLRRLEGEVGGRDDGMDDFEKDTGGRSLRSLIGYKDNSRIGALDGKWLAMLD